MKNPHKKISALLGPESVGLSRVTPTIGTQGMIVSDDPIASEWGAELLRKGGNAIDAAIGAAFVLAVTRPYFASIGGGGFLLHRSHTNTSTLFNFRELSPELTTRKLYQHRGSFLRERLQNGPLSCGTPGAVAGYLHALECLGTQRRARVMSRAIEVARQGFRVTGHFEKAALQRWASMSPAARNLFGNGQSPHAPGTLFKQPDLAQILERISKLGAPGFYTGPVAKKITQGIQEAGGVLQEQDFKSYSVLTDPPRCSTFAKWNILTASAPSIGGQILLELLKKTEKAGHLEFSGAPTLKTLSQIMASAFQPLSVPQSSNTTHLSVIDRAGNAVALTATINDHFGSAFVPPKTGIVMNSVLDDFTADPQTPNLFDLCGGHANLLEPNKRPFSCMTPTIAHHASGEILVLGGAGGPRIITAVFQSLINRIQFRMSLADAIAAPRFHHQGHPDILRIEQFGFAPEVRTALGRAGFTLDDSVHSLGRVFGASRTPHGRTQGIADPRSEGAAVAE